MSRFSITRLRKAVAWAEKEAAKERALRNWDQSTWAKGQKGRVRRVEVIDGTKISEVLEAQDKLVEVKCRSSYCVAGNVCADEKDTFVAPSWASTYEGYILADYVIPKGTKEAISIEYRARDLLGITESEAERLFAGHNTIGDIKRIASHIARNHGKEL